MTDVAIFGAAFLLGALTMGWVIYLVVAAIFRGDS